MRRTYNYTVVLEAMAVSGTNTVILTDDPKRVFKELVGAIDKAGLKGVETHYAAKYIKHNGSRVRVVSIKTLEDAYLHAGLTIQLLCLYTFDIPWQVADYMKTRVRNLVNYKSDILYHGCIMHLDK